MSHGVKKRDEVRLQNRAHFSNAIDSGVKSTAQVEAYKPVRRPPLKFLLRRVKIDRPVGWREDQPETMGSLKKPRSSD